MLVVLILCKTFYTLYIDVKILYIFSTAPSHVENLQLVPGTLGGSLRASWSAGAGDMDFYTVFLLQNASVESIRRVPKQDIKADFEDLVPGQLYTVGVQTVSGELTNSSTVSGRTGEE